MDCLGGTAGPAHAQGAALFAGLDGDAVAADILDVAGLLALSRAHWQIENRLFRVRDGTFAEDACRVRTGRAPKALAHLRDAALTLIRKRRLKPKPAREAFAANPRAAIRAIMRA